MLPQTPPRGDSVASGPRPGRMLPEAMRGGLAAMCGGLAHERGVEWRFGHFWRNRHVGGSAYTDLLLTLAEIIALVCRVGIDVLTMHRSHAVAHALPPRSASENRDLYKYEG